MSLEEFVGYLLALWLVIGILAAIEVEMTAEVFFASGLLAFLIDIGIAILKQREEK